MKTQIDDAMALIRMEYAEWPGLKLSFWQAQRLWNLPEDVCGGALRTLTEAKVLARAADGDYVRRTPHAGRQRMVPACRDSAAFREGS